MPKSSEMDTFKNKLALAEKNREVSSPEKALQRSILNAPAEARMSEKLKTDIKDAKKLLLSILKQRTAKPGEALRENYQNIVDLNSLAILLRRVEDEQSAQQALNYLKRFETALISLAGNFNEIFSQRGISFRNLSALLEQLISLYSRYTAALESEQNSEPQ